MMEEVKNANIADMTETDLKKVNSDSGVQTVRDSFIKKGKKITVKQISS